MFKFATVTAFAAAVDVDGARRGHGAYLGFGAPLGGLKMNALPNRDYVVAQPQNISIPRGGLRGNPGRRGYVTPSRGVVSPRLGLRAQRGGYRTPLSAKRISPAGAYGNRLAGYGSLRGSRYGKGYGGYGSLGRGYGKGNMRGGYNRLGGYGSLSRGGYGRGIGAGSLRGGVVRSPRAYSGLPGSVGRSYGSVGRGYTGYGKINGLDRTGYVSGVGGLGRGYGRLPQGPMFKNSIGYQNGFDQKQFNFNLGGQFSGFGNTRNFSDAFSANKNGYLNNGNIPNISSIPIPTSNKTARPAPRAAPVHNKW